MKTEPKFETQEEIKNERDEMKKFIEGLILTEFPLSICGEEPFNAPVLIEKRTFEVMKNRMAMAKGIFEATERMDKEKQETECDKEIEQLKIE